MTATPRQPSTVLFLCSGNYYRSRFAEYLFNTYVRDTELAWRAESRGIIVDRVTDNLGPISRYTVDGLAQRGIPVPEPPRFPIQLGEADLVAAHLVIAVKEAEHRPLLAERFPSWSERVEYWHIHDLDRASSPDTLTALSHEVAQLIRRLRSQTA